VTDGDPTAVSVRPACARPSRARGASRVVARLLSLLALCTTAACASSLVSPNASAAISEREEHFTSHGREVAVDHYSPPSSGRHPAVIVLHGSGGLHLFFGRGIQAYAEALAASGFESFVVHYYDGTDTFVADDDEERAKFFDWVRVVGDAVTYVESRPTVRPRQVNILGQSLGAYLAVGAAAADPRVASAVIVSGGLEPFLKDRVSRMPPTLVLHGDADDVVPIAEANTLVSFMHERHMSVEMHAYPGEGHDFADATDVDAVERAARFMRGKRVPRALVPPIAATDSARRTTPPRP
jgi:carboxymethylenebutenolidase